MTQDSDRRSSSSNRRSARAGRNRPVLVTSTTNEENQQASLEETTPTLEESLSELQEQNPPVAPTSPASRRLPNFFSTIGRRGQAEASSETDAAQARLARATRGKVSPTKASSDTKSEQKPEVKKAASTNKASTPARPASGFKTRYLIGMGLYLLGANFIGYLETSFFQSNHIDSVLARFNLFGALITVSTSTLAFLATLIILLVLLARFDLIPRNFAAMTGQSSSTQANRRGTSSSSNKNQKTSENVRNLPPTMKQGVKGADDDLYQEYRANQRREKKK